MLFVWDAPCQKAFEEFCRLINSPILHYPDVSKGHYYIETDGSNLGLGAVLSQKDDQGRFGPIAYASSGLSERSTKIWSNRNRSTGVCLCS
ncbi:MAG: hypothetical protein GY816_11760, partial [Cytophagales bacterium]|nr:hypothetical protein [Cytophagales bacterium]